MSSCHIPDRSAVTFGIKDHFHCVLRFIVGLHFTYEGINEGNSGICLLSPVECGLSKLHCRSFRNNPNWQIITDLRHRILLCPFFHLSLCTVSFPYSRLNLLRESESLALDRITSLLLPVR